MVEFKEDAIVISVPYPSPSLEHLQAMQKTLVEVNRVIHASEEKQTENFFWLSELQLALCELKATFDQEKQIMQILKNGNTEHSQ